MNFSKIVLGVSSLLYVLTSCGNRQGAVETNLQSYPTTEISGKSVELLSVYPTTVKGQEVIEIRPRIDGFIEKVFVDEGSAVRKGQSLFKINSPVAEQSLRNAMASVKSAEAQVSTAKTNVERIRPLVEKGIVSEIQLKTANDAYATANAALEQATAALENARAMISWTNVSAPVDGLVGEISYRLGSLVNSSNVLTTVSNTGNVFAYFSINEKELVAFLNAYEGKTQAEKLKNVPPVTLMLSDGTIYEHKGKLETIAGSINITTGTANFRAEFPNPGGKLKSGISGNVSIPRHLDDAFVIPQKATFSLQDKVLIYLVQGDSVVQKTITVLPVPEGKDFVVTDGLKAGDKVVLDGIATLSHGKKIAIN